MTEDRRPDTRPASAPAIARWDGSHGGLVPDAPASELHRYDEFGRPYGVAPIPGVRVTDEERRRRLTLEIRGLVLAGSRIETRNEFDAVLARGSEVNHVLHSIVTLATVGLWAPVWLYVALSRGVRRTFVTVDGSGYVERQEMARS